MQNQEIAITAIGTGARDLLEQDQAAWVMGATSRGLFLYLAADWVIFITPETFHGPLTLNFPVGARDLPTLEHGTPARVQAGGIYFPDRGIMISTAYALAWEAPPPPKKWLSASERTERLKQITRLALSQGRASSISALLPALLDLEFRSNYEGNTLFVHLERLERSWQEGGVAALAESIQAFLGLGSGLTPSGDDLVNGLLLALARWGQVVAPGLEFDALVAEVLPRAYRSTTTLSANLIECALRGQANERLLLALDGIMSGEPDPTVCASALTGWGNTSGLDALVGMALAVKILLA